MQKCAKKITPPGNGALACDKWYGGKFCQMLCKEGYDVSPGRNFEEMLVCGESGEWLPKNALPLPDCSSKQFLNLFLKSFVLSFHCFIWRRLFFFQSQYQQDEVFTEWLFRTISTETALTKLLFRK